ncbi:hypothetical protein F8S09_11485 [Deinococcus sp. SDU3-2]|uniref:Uncharacterized protein n=1 Tax=Deinococcus terrestris TaxID=2651870 RepID=A0A7X1NWU9_9DEIO|nr:hypothetical protein [Deinococcus terrestris]MPY67306.1 hypothetical protein [Deinococcus terrestris]
MRPWMLEAPPAEPSDADLIAFGRALEARDPGLLPPGTTRWLFLDWLTAQGFLLHGSPQAGIQEFEVRQAVDLSSDGFSNRAGVYATPDGLWALMYALRNRSRVARMVNMALQIRKEGGWSTMRYFLSLAPRGPAVPDGRSLLSPGWVYVLPLQGFDPMPPYEWPGMGTVREPQWVSPDPVRPLFRVPVAPDDFPLPVRTHEAARVDARCAADPWGFPWLEEEAVTPPHRPC